MPINCFPEIHFTVVVAMYLLCIYFVLGIAANGRRDYPPQVKPPPVLQLLLELAEELAELAEKDTTDDIFLRVCVLLQSGQAGSWFASEKRSCFSNSAPQSLQRYS
jgi:hypothetical protein